MGLFSSTPEEIAEKQRKKAEKAQREAQAAFDATPTGQARLARSRGASIFQIDLPLSRTTGVTVALQGAYAHTSQTANYANLIQSIESEGWELEHAGYVYRITGSVSRDKTLASGQQEAVHGEIVGIYLFRVSQSAQPSPSERS